MLRRELVCSRPVVPSATPSRPAAATRSDPPCTACSAATPAPWRVTPTRMPTSRRVSSGRRTLWYVQALNATPPGRRSHLVEMRMTNVTLTLTVRVPREPQEVHPWHQDGLRWSEEGEGQERPDHVRLRKIRPLSLLSFMLTSSRQFPEAVYEIDGDDRGGVMIRQLVFALRH